MNVYLLTFPFSFQISVKQKYFLFMYYCYINSKFNEKLKIYNPPTVFPVTTAAVDTVLS